MREIRPSGSMSGEWNRSMVKLVRHRQTKEPETDRLLLNHRATPRLYYSIRGVSRQNGAVQLKAIKVHEVPRELAKFFMDEWSGVPRRWHRQAADEAPPTIRP